MSKIRLHGSSSGYTEIAPVAASGNNTLTLPNDGTIISKDSNGAVGVTSITVGTGVTIGDGRVTCTTVHGSAASLTQIPAANIVGVCTSGLTKTGGFGKIIQIKHVVDATTGSTSSNSFTNSPVSSLNTNITPVAAGSKILMIVHLNIEMGGANSGSILFARDPAGSPSYFGNSGADSSLAPSNNSTGATKIFLSQGYGGVNGTNVCASGEDSPSYSLGNTLTYGILVGCNGNTLYYNSGPGGYNLVSQLILMEVAA